MAIRLPRLQSQTPIVEKTGAVAAPFQRYWQSVVEQIERALNLIVELTGIQEQFETAIQQAQEAAQDARDAADEAKAAQAAAAKERSLENSTIDPTSVLTADPTTITIAAHSRAYADGTSVAVNGGTVAATAAGDTDYVFYDDTARAGGTVTYQVSTGPQVQGSDRHNVGAVTIPTTGTADGGDGPRPPGWVIAKLESIEP